MGSIDFDSLFATDSVDIGKPSRVREDDFFSRRVHFLGATSAKDCASGDVRDQWWGLGE